MTFFVVSSAAVLGACIGSFLNVVVSRVPRGESIARPASRCPSCGTALRARENVPVLSWLVLRARCAHCGASISWRYPLVELCTAGIWAASTVRFGIGEEGVVVAITASILLALSMIDLEHRRLPNVIVLPATAVALVWVIVSTGVSGDWGRLLGSVVSGAAAFAAFFLLALFSGGMGFGDVKLAGFIGIVTGWFDPAVTLAAVFGAFIVGGLISVVLLIFRRAGRKSAIPFGPSLAIGCVWALFLGAGPVRSYLGY